MVDNSTNHDYLRFEGDKEVKKIVRDGKLVVNIILNSNLYNRNNRKNFIY
jgi:hypothetical protein